jgi:lipopolysaccharide transport system ATP-binding protein
MRLAFDVAAHLEPEILLVDEVLAVGDAAFQKKCVGKMSAVAREGRTVLFVSHNMAAVRTLCKSAILLDDGRKVFESVVDRVIDRYLETSTNEGCSGKLLPSMHSVNTGELWIDEVTLTNEGGRPLADLRMGEPFTVTIRFEERLPAQRIRIGLGFNTLEGVRIATLHHTDGGQEFFSADCGTYEVSVGLTNPFLPGTYIVGVGAHRALAGATIDYVPEALRFHVLEVSASEDTHQVYNPGLIRLKACWSSPRKIDQTK